MISEDLTNDKPKLINVPLTDSMLSQSISSWNRGTSMVTTDVPSIAVNIDGDFVRCPHPSVTFIYLLYAIIHIYVYIRLYMIYMRSALQVLMCASVHFKIEFSMHHS